jgi:hypothetical protein
VRGILASIAIDKWKRSCNLRETVEDYN